MLLGRKHSYEFTARIVQYMKHLGVSAARDLLSKYKRMIGMIKRYVSYKAPIAGTSYLTVFDFYLFL